MCKRSQGGPKIVVANLDCMKDEIKYYFWMAAINFSNGPSSPSFAVYYYSIFLHRTFNQRDSFVFFLTAFRAFNARSIEM